MAKVNFIPAMRQQEELIRDTEHTYLLFSGGVGSGKSEVGAFKLLCNHVANKCPSLMIGLDHGQIGGNMALRIESLWNKYFRSYGKISIHLHGNKDLGTAHIMAGKYPILCLSAENPKKIAGFEVGSIWIDEALRIREGATPMEEFFPNAVARLRHPKAKYRQVIVTSTPEGSSHFLWKKFVTEKKADFNCKVWFCKSLDNKFLPPEAVADMRAAYSAELIEQYLEGKALDYQANRAHRNFTEDNIIDNFQPSIAQPIYLGCDFNVAPMCWVVMQEVDKKIIVFDEIVIKNNAQVDHGINAGVNKRIHKFPLTYICPDPSSRARNLIGPSQLETLLNGAQRYGWHINSTKVMVHHPPVIERIQNLGRLICNGTNERQLFVTRNCETLIYNLKNTNCLANGAYDPGPKKELGHILDALGYALWTLKIPTQRIVGFKGL